MPFLSIITINRNNAAGLRRTLESVRCQTSADWEHIIIDGASTDGSVSVIQEFLADSNYAKRVAYWVSEPDRGIYDAMNKGIPHASGRYCLFLNSGDYLADGGVVARLGKHDLGGDIAYADAILFSGKREWKVTFPDKLDAYFFYGRTTLNHQNMLFPVPFVKANPYSLQYKISSDVDLYTKAFFNSGIRFRHIDDTIAKFESCTGIGSIQENRDLRSKEWDAILKEHIAEQYIGALELLDTYEKKYHGILKKQKNILTAYTRLKSKLKRGNKK